MQPFFQLFQSVRWQAVAQDVEIDAKCGQTLADLVERRTKVEAQFESCALAIQNMRFDLLRLRSAGVSAVLDNLTMVTQQAKALSVDVNAAIEAADEIKEVIGRSTPA